MGLFVGDEKDGRKQEKCVCVSQSGGGGGNRGGNNRHHSFLDFTASPPRKKLRWRRWWWWWWRWRWRWRWVEGPGGEFNGNRKVRGFGVVTTEVVVGVQEGSMGESTWYSSCLPPSLLSPLFYCHFHPPTGENDFYCLFNCWCNVLLRVWEWVRFWSQVPATLIYSPVSGSLESKATTFMFPVDDLLSFFFIFFSLVTRGGSAEKELKSKRERERCIKPWRVSNSIWQIGISICLQTY